MPVSNTCKNTPLPLLLSVCHLLDFHHPCQNSWLSYEGNIVREQEPLRILFTLVNEMPRVKKSRRLTAPKKHKKERLLHRLRAKASQKSEWVRVDADGLPLGWRCPFDQQPTDAYAYDCVWRFRGARNVHLCDLCFPHNICFFSYDGYPTLDALLLGE